MSADAFLSQSILSAEGYRRAVACNGFTIPVNGTLSWEDDLTEL